MPRRIAIALLLVAVGLTGTGVTVAVVRTGTGPGAGKVPPWDPRTAVVSALSVRPQDVADSARYAVRTVLEGRGSSQEIVRRQGVADLEQQRFLAVVQMPGDSPPEFDSFIFARWEYTRALGEQGPWRRAFLGPRSLDGPLPYLGVIARPGENLLVPPYANDLDVRARIVDALVTDVIPRGVEELRGTDVWHYRVTLDKALALGRLPAPIVAAVRAWDDLPDYRHVDVWLDAEGRTRKLAVRFVGYLVENEFWDFGGPGRLDLPADLGDPTAVGGEGTTSFSLRPGVELAGDSPGTGMTISSLDGPGDDDVRLEINDYPFPLIPGVEFRRRTIHIWPAAGHLLPGDYHIAARGAGLSAFRADIHEVAERCALDSSRSGILTVLEAVRHERGYYVRLHVRFTLSCRAPGDSPVSFTGEARYFSLT